jgi:hypothetical protein
MRSVADIFREQTREEATRLTPADRIALALALGDDDAAMLANWRGISVPEARRVIRRSRDVGRHRSCASEAPQAGRE